MQENSDVQLLREYAQGANEAAFRELVARHTDLIYSAAVRQVGSPEAARDVAQSVFVDLARKAKSLAETANESESVLGWLYRATRFAALNHIRDERRRQDRERQVMKDFDPNSESTTDWERIRPVLDEVMADLNDEDRQAVLLRFFKNRDFRSVGEALGVSDDAAQKRVSRALEKLRTEFVRRGVTTTAVALAGTLSANAVQAAPAGLAVAFSSAALSGVTVATVNTATATVVKAIAMSTMQKMIIGTTLAVVAGAGIYQAYQTSNLRGENVALRQQQGRLTETLEQLRRERDDATNRLGQWAQVNATAKSNLEELMKLRGEVARLQRESREAGQGMPGNASDAAAVTAWANRVTQLRQRLEQTPEAKIPELQYVTQQDWLSAAKGELNSEADYRRALSTLRGAGESKFASMIKGALKKYIRANSGQMPTDMNQLASYFDSPPDQAALDRWEVAPAKTVQSLGLGGDVLITQRAAVDDVFDSRYGIGPNGTGSTDFLSRQVAGTMNPVWEAYRSAHNGQWPDDVSELQSYVNTPEQQVAWQKLMMKRAGEK
jgi:RNA polymerase sigma factor (sigma-70 family)